MGWLSDLLKQGLMLLLVILLLIMVASCVLRKVTDMIENAMHKVWLAQEEKGGIVGMCLRENGHVSQPPYYERLD